MHTKFIVVCGKDKGMGGFMNPPGHAEHTYSVIEVNVSGPNREQGSMSLSYAASDETPLVPAHVKADCKRILAAHPGEYTDAWERRCYPYWKNCYRDAERLEYGKPGTLIFPVPYYKLKPLMKQNTVGQIGQYSEEYLATQNAERTAHNDAEIARAAAIATPENHSAYLFIRSFFPDAKPRLDLIANPPDDYGKPEVSA